VPSTSPRRRRADWQRTTQGTDLPGRSDGARPQAGDRKSSKLGPSDYIKRLRVTVR